jgi:long-chain-acyl-CoA dehydrogenase
MPIEAFPARWMTDEHRMLQGTVRRLFHERWVPRAAQWRRAGIIDRSAWREAAEHGLLCAAMPVGYGGGGGDFGFDAVIILEQARANLNAFGGAMHSAIVAPYINEYGTPAQRARWLPKMATAELIGALAMTEPDAGSDVQAIRCSAQRDGEYYLLSGQKSYITNGDTANLVIVACKTDCDRAAHGISLLAVETDGLEGFRRGPRLDKIGMKAQDTCDLFFDAVRVPVANLIGEVEGQGFAQLMQQLPQERLIVAVGGIGAMERALADTLAYTKQRKTFGKPVWQFQNTRIKLAEVQATVLATRAFVDACIEAQIGGRLGVDRAALAKCWVSEQQGRVIDECLQLHGGAGYMLDVPVAELYVDARVQRIYGGSNEILKELAARFM